MSETTTTIRPRAQEADGRAIALNAQRAQREPPPLRRETLKLEAGQVTERSIHAHPPLAAILRSAFEGPAPNDDGAGKEHAGLAESKKSPTPWIDRDEIRRKTAQETTLGNPGSITETELDEQALWDAEHTLTEGAKTPSYHLDPDAVSRMLGDALAMELVCALRYKRHHFTAQGLNSPSVAQEFAEHARQEFEHADKLARRISQLGGKPDFDPETLTARSYARYDGLEGLREMLESDLGSERVAIEAYRQMIEIVGTSDSTTRRLLEDILAEEEQHANELMDLMPYLSKESA